MSKRVHLLGNIAMSFLECCTAYRGCHSKFPDFSLTLDHFPDPSIRQILAIFIYRQSKYFECIFDRADLIFKKKISNHKYKRRNVSEHKLNAIYVQKHSFSNIASNLWKIKFPEACQQATFLEILKFLTFP